MLNDSYVRSALAKAGLELTPPLIRATLLEEPDFREKYDLEVESFLSFGDSDISFQQSHLFQAIRKILAGMSVIEVTDTNNRTWKLKDISGENELPSLSLSQDKQKLIIPGFCVLSPDRSTRLQYFDEAALNNNLSRETFESWRNVLSKRALEDDEVSSINSELQDTPVEKARSILKEIEKGSSTTSSLVPSSRRYFERLIGKYNKSHSIDEYIPVLRTFFERLSEWQQYDGFLFSLLLSSHSAITVEIKIERLEDEELIRAFDFLNDHGDRLSQLGAIEVGLRVLPSRPEIEPALIRLIEQIRDDDIGGQSSGFNLLSALFILVDGELSRTRLFASEPPFFRRLASLSHAALIQRQLVNSGINIDLFCDWALNNRSEQYYMQSLADMQIEPRWDPDLAMASQLKADFFGRIMIAAYSYKENIEGTKLYDLILGTEPDSLHSIGVYPHPFFPGPLEGTENTTNYLPKEINDAIEKQLGAEVVGLSSFIALVNSALIYRIGTDLAELAANTLNIGNYHLVDIEDRSQLLAILNGLATVAAVSRSVVLADELRILVRKYRSDAQYALSIEEALRICLVSAAGHSELDKWREFVGEWLVELAYGDLDGDSGELLFSRLQCLLHADPELWVSCGRAEAALKAYNAI